MQEVAIAMVLIEQAGKYLLQLRGADPAVGGAGLVGCFGGKREAGETAEQTACRELSEETNLAPQPTDLKHLGVVQVASDMKLKPVRVTADVFLLNLDAVTLVESREGELVTMTLDEVKAAYGRLTTGTRACFEELVATA